jgi:hypothetical protein
MARSERGFALVLALGMTVVLSMTVVTVIESTTANERTADQSRNRVSAFSLAEAGMNYATSILAASNAYDVHLLHPQPPNQPADCANPPRNPSSAPALGNTCSPLVYTLDGGTATVSGTFDANTANWSITSTGQVRNPFGGQATTRTLTSAVHVRAQPSQTNYVTAWNYIFVKDTTPNVCNMMLDQSTNFSVSLYVAGNLCFQNTAFIAETDPSNPINLEVLGKIVYLSGSSKGVGDTSLPNNGQVTTAKIGGGCATSVGGAAHTCSPPGDYFYVKPGGYSQSAPAITSPSLTDTDFQGYYTSAYIGRVQPACSSSANGGTTLTGASFDNNTTPLDGVGGNGSLGTFDLTPATGNYSCQVKDSGGRVIGELDWDNTNKLLKVRGTIYIDGSVTISQSAAYQGVDSTGVHTSGSSDGQGGKAVIYASGQYSTGNNLSLCGWNTTTNTPATTNGTLPVNATCDYSKWSPNTSMLMLVLHGTPTSFNIGGGNGCYFQGAVYAVGNATLGQQCFTDGPFIAGSLTVGQGVNMRPLPGIQDLPVGAPGNPNTQGIPEAPAYTSG